MAEVARIPAGPKIREWSAKYGFSDALVARITKVIASSDLGPASVRHALEGLINRAPDYIRANPIRTSATELRRRLEARGFAINKTPLDNNILRITYAPISAGATLEHLLGMSTPQDLASGSAPIALGAKPGDVVADLAAAPGIKSLHLAADMKNSGTLVCCEPDPIRMRALQFNAERCGVSNAIFRNHDAQSMPGEAWADKVMLDAPCTGEGTLPKDRSRRRGDISEVARLASLQQELTDAADRILKPGGTMVYATCTFAPEENEGQVQRLIERGYTVENLPFDSCGAPLARGLTDWPGLDLDESISKTVRFIPGIHPTLGFYVAKLRKGAN